MQDDTKCTSARGPSHDELPDLAEDVVYEMQMFFAAAEQYGAMAMTERERLLTPMEQSISNAWSEVHWLHFRNLLDFFTSEPRQDDVVAGHYVPGWTKRYGGEALKELEGFRSRCNKHLQHLAAARKRQGSVADPPDTPGYTATKMKVLTDAFFTRLDSERMSWFAPHLESWQAFPDSGSVLSSSG